MVFNEIPFTIKKQKNGPFPYHQVSPWFQPGLLRAFPRESTGQPTKGTAKGTAKVLISKLIYKWIDC